MIKNASSKAAFTLVELLVVISIILITSSIIMIGGSSGEGAKLSSSQRIVSGIAQGARGQAILKNQKTRLIIYSDAGGNNDDEKKLRYFGIIYVAPDEPDAPNSDGATEPKNWIAATQGTYLPEGIYFNPDLSSANNWATSSMQINFPRQLAQSAGSGEEYYYYEFNGNGTMATGFDNDWLVLQAGTLKPSAGGALKVDFDEPDKQGLKAALIFRRTGTTTQVNDPGDVN